ncbi:MAG: DUF2335 domain-containing protein [Magnetococcales bacterium]|nr:DUF2335 domain-containing protein [Magnetococcales bacterium]
MFCLCPEIDYFHLVPDSPRAQIAHAWFATGHEIMKAMDQFEHEQKAAAGQSSTGKPSYRVRSGVANHEVRPPSRELVHANISFEGPIPPPRIMEKYEELVPGSADRILRMAEKSVDFQHSMTRDALSLQANDTRRGQWFAFLVAFGALVAGVIAIPTGNPGTGAAIISTTLAGGIGTFIISRRNDDPPETPRRDDSQG